MKRGRCRKEDEKRTASFYKSKTEALDETAVREKGREKC